MQKRLISLSVLLLSLALMGAAPAPSSVSSGERPVVLAPEAYQSEAAKLATYFLTNYHYQDVKLDDEMSRNILDNYLEGMDPNKLYFLASDIEEFSQGYANALDDSLRGQDLAPAFVIFNRYRQRVMERVAKAEELNQQSFDFTVEESYLADRSDLPWAQTVEELDELWRKRVKDDVLRLRLAEKPEDEIASTLADRYENLRRRVEEMDAEDVFQLYMNAFASAIEPHTGYMAPRSSENFQISMRLSLEGIGAVLQRDNEYTAIRYVVPGGPADKDGRLKAGDRIVAVGQENDSTVDVIGWRLDDVVEIIRGPKGSEVRLDVIPADKGLDAAHETIRIVRNEVKLEEQAARSEIIEETDENGDVRKVGVIRIPAFYLDFAAKARQDPNYRSTTRDVRKILDELTAENVDGVVIDLRDNGGGSLEESTQLTGLFIESGPVVQVRDARGTVQIERDPDPQIAYDGPLAVLVNRNSASASEIFAAALQDYGRAVVIGEPTFGKGTVQHLINLDDHSGREQSRLGQLKLTRAQFFRINGGSTQNRGVIPDIMYQTMAEDEEYGERSLDNALPWNSIRAADYAVHGDLASLIPYIERQHASRVAEDEEFQALLAEVAAFHEIRNKNEISLYEPKRKAERDEAESLRQQRNAGNDEVTALAEALEDSADAAEDEDAIEPPDVLLREAARILGDLIKSQQGTALALRTEDPSSVN
ncbi:MAG: tail-specific protease [Lysobacteraceae bacterium]|nr:MAG: tail-specific protease [Xanthomonadaceae bacterium]